MNTRSRGSILELGKSKDSFEEQIQAACSILDIDLQCWRRQFISYESLSTQAETGYGIKAPSYEWTLNWLLKKLEAYNDTDSACLLQDAWLLLQYLIIHTRPAKVARLLANYKYIGILRNTLDRLSNDCNDSKIGNSPTNKRPRGNAVNLDAAQSNVNDYDGSHPNGTDPETTGSPAADYDAIPDDASRSNDDMSNVLYSGSSQGSGSVLEGYSGDEGSDLDLDRTSRKRKRYELDDLVHEEISNNLAHVRSMLGSVFGSLTQIERLLANELRSGRSILTEQLEYALRPSMNEAASILGSGILILIYIGQQACPKPSQTFQDTRIDKLRIGHDVLSTYFHAFLGLWGKQAHIDGIEAEQCRVAAFTQNSLVPCLLLLNYSRRSLHRDGVLKTIADELESLISKNVFQHMQISNTENDLVNLFRHPIPQQSLPPANDRTQQINSHAHLKAVLLTLFFEIAIKHESNKNPKNRNEHVPFLQSLFNTLKSSAQSTFGLESSVDLSRDYTETLTLLLGKANEHQLQLDIPSIEPILNETAILTADADPQQINWRLTSLCLENNPDVFVLSIDAPSGGYSYRKPNRLLVALLAPLADIRTEAHHDQRYVFVLSRVLIPLLHAFAEARDLPGFLEHWRERLDTHLKIDWSIQKDARRNNVSESLWEDDGLMNAAQALIESSLSISQLENMLTAAESHLWNLARGNDRSFSIAQLVILETLLSGCHSESFRTKFSGLTDSIYEALAKIALEDDLRYGEQRWRIWRILSLIDLRWPSVRRESCSLDDSDGITNGAFTVLEGAAALPDACSVAQFQESSHAFSVLISQALYHHRSTKDKPSISLELLEKSLQRLMGWMDDSSRESRESSSASIVHSEQAQCWSGRTADIRSEDTLLLSCIMQLVTRPVIICQINPSIQLELLRSLYRRSLFEKNHVPDLSHDQISFQWLWNRFQHCGMLIEDLKYQRNLRRVQAEIYLRLVQSRDEQFNGLDHVGYIMAFEGLQGAAATQFDLEDRIDIANGLLDMLSDEPSLGLPSVDEHLQLLAKFAGTPKKSGRFKRTVRDERTGLGHRKDLKMLPEAANEPVEKSMRVFQCIKSGHGPSATNAAILVLAEMMNSRSWDVEVQRCDDALLRITNIVLEYTFATLSLDMSVQYLIQIYRWIGQILHRTLAGIDLSPCERISSSSTLLLMTTLKYFHEHRDEASTILDRDADTIGDLRLQHLDTLYALLGSKQHKPDRSNSAHALSVMMDCLWEYSDLIPHPWSGSSVLDRSISDLTAKDDSKALGKSLGRTSHEGFFLRAKYHKLMMKLDPSYQSFDTLLNMFNLAQDAPHGLLNPRLLSYCRDLMQKPKLDIVKRALTIVGASGSKELSLAILRATLYYIRDEDIDTLRSEASSVFPKVCQMLLESNGTRKAILAVQCITILLQKHPRTISQPNIETLLSTVAEVARRLRLKKASEPAAKVYLGLCHLIGVILSTHRTKLGGRYDLLLPVLQPLLRPLFTPYSKSVAIPKQKSAFRTAHASAYARLLSRLADPSPSAVGRPQSRRIGTLNDETKREKGIVGQHLHYLIIIYCECQLTGKVSEEGMRQALEPGLWSVLECTEPEVLRTLNAGMNSSERSIWKRLYEDWKKFGQWQGD